MMKIFVKAAFLTAFVLSIGAFVGVSAQSVTGSIANGTVKKGVATRGSVVLSVPAGLHVNSSRPGSEYAIPTSVQISGKGVKVSPVTYPKGKNRKFDFSENTLNVYEGRTAFPFTVTVPANFSGYKIALNVTVRYQACTNEVCYPPKSKSIKLTALVR